MHKADGIIPWLGSALISYGTAGLSVTVTVENYCAANVKKLQNLNFQRRKSKKSSEAR